jgi:translation initiation factor 5A
MEAGQIRVGGHILIKGNPCKVSAVSTSKTGKHGSAKCNFTAIDIFTGKKYEDVCPSTQNVQVPNVIRTDYSLMDISVDGFTSLLFEDSSTREDIKLPEYPDNLAKEIIDAFASGKQYIVTVLSAMDHEQIVSFKEETSQ